ncbi:hypothetical protein DSO57_1024319 [Entomophthora muscae]|uniref:Uncharacterized protein n=1 Tax=Entomophthora muscae TaxID=34485 RepID=A0ACC2U0M4_9FUNG|nr:hypothetical protein DSO57_1024319 [Entomophthora muscae]
MLEEFALMQAKYKLLTNHSPLLGNDNSSKPVPGYDPGQTLETGGQEPHRGKLDFNQCSVKVICVEPPAAPPDHSVSTST